MRLIRFVIFVAGMVCLWLSGFFAGQWSVERTLLDTLKRHPPKVEQLWMVAPRSLPYEYEDLKRR